MPRMKLGILGCGAIGSALAQKASAIPGLQVAAVCDLDHVKARGLAQKISPEPVVTEMFGLAAACDLLLEAASQAAVPQAVAAALAEKKDLMVMSVGALLGHPEWREQFHAQGCRLHFPSGAVGGLDALKAAMAGGGVKQVRLITRKPPLALAGAPYFLQKKIQPEAIQSPTVIFFGNARQAIALFPANVNVAAAVALAGVGPDETQVEVIADPGADGNSHTLTIEGDFGSFQAVTNNRPLPENPKTSAQAVYSALALLQSLAQGERSGT